MKMIIETFVSIFFLTMLVIVATQLIESQIQINAANDFHINVVQAIEESNFDTYVIEECKGKAIEKGYHLDVEVDKSSVYQCVSCNNILDDVNHMVCPLCGSGSIYVNHTRNEGRVCMNYQVELSILGISREGRLEANAR